MFSDIVGYTALMAESEARGLRARERHRELFQPLASRYHGQIMDETGDELLLVFPSDLDAVNCALAAQAELRGSLTARIEPWRTELESKPAADRLVGSTHLEATLMGRTVLTLVGLLWAAFGVACLFAPAGMLSQVGIKPVSPVSIAEIRAMYGGAQIGLGAFLVFASRDPQLVRAALIVLAFTMGGFAVGRLCGVLVDRSLEGVTLISLATEVGLFALAAFVLSRERPSMKATQ